MQASGCAGMQATCSTRMNNRIRSLAKSFACAASGMKYCVLCERNFRIHLVATAYVLAMALLIDVDGTDFAILLLTAGAVIVMEMVNTAVEAVVDLASPQVHPLARVAKDVAAGAVLVAGVGQRRDRLFAALASAKLLLLGKSGAGGSARPRRVRFVRRVFGLVYLLQRTAQGRRYKRIRQLQMKGKFMNYTEPQYETKSGVRCHCRQAERGKIEPSQRVGRGKGGDRLE